jgi:murein DD-endopeptidase MepM/ murein hydrolase activator NlpD
MSSDTFGPRAWPLLRATALAVIAVGAAACSSETARFDSPFASQQPRAGDTTASVQQQQLAPAGRVQTASLPPPSGSEPAPQAGSSGGGRGMASYQPGQSPDPVVTGSMPPQSQPSGPQRQVALPPVQRQAAAPARPAGAQGQVHVVAPGDTLMRISRTYSVSLSELARHNNIPPHTKVNIGDQIRIPGGARTAAAAPLQNPAQARPELAKANQPKALSEPAAAKGKALALANPEPKSEPKAKAAVAAAPAPTQTASVATPAAAEPPAANPVRNGSMAFRWPAKGRVIAGFGPRTNGQSNDGINIAVPEGTPVKAAADGTVAYAGNELKGYGNLVLVRHADGYVTAYAHAKELLVRRGDTVRRGQDIARSGQTGNVDTPQLHFEIRKGPAPIDPMPYLNGG